MKGSKMKGDENYVKDLRAIARVNEIALKLKEMERILKIRKDESNEMKKEELMNYCRDENDTHDCGMCEYEFTDTCNLRLEKIKKDLQKLEKGCKKEMKGQKVMEVIEKDINSFSKLVLSLAIIQASNAINELIKVIIEDNFNKKQNETEKEIN